MVRSAERKEKLRSQMASLHFLSIFLLFTFSLPTPTTSSNGDVDTLMALKSSLDPKDHVLGTWTLGGDPCKGDFEGVLCNSEGKVVSISLQGKGLDGVLSPAVARLKSLNALYLHYNKLSGEIPKEIGDLAELVDLYLNVNNFTGSVPMEIGNLANLQVLQLCYNQLSGSIPTQLGQAKKLNVLALQSNHLTGAIPASLGNLTRLLRLDLSFNRLFGSIPSTLVDITSLTVLDLRNNSLSGNVPFGLKRLSTGFLYANNTGLCGIGFKTLQSCPTDDPSVAKKPESVSKPQQIPQSANPNTGNPTSYTKHSSVGAIVGSFVAVCFAAFGAFFAFLYFRRQKQKIGSSLDVSDSRLSTDQSNYLYKKHASPLVSLECSNRWDATSEEEMLHSLRFNLEEVECATQYFSEVNLLNKSTFGTSTYKGTLRDGTIVAIKRISKTSCKAEEADFLKGLKLVTLLRHENLVALRGFCCSRGRGECFLVYEFMANGCLSDYLDLSGDQLKGRFLDWGTRVCIIKGIAKGIGYLHSNRANKPSLLHQNISAEKVLLDRHFMPHLSNAGVHKLLADDIVFSALKSSAAMGYLAPEYTTTGRFTEKSDIYAFGVLTLQILTGKRKVFHRRISAEFGKLDELVDENLNGDFSRAEAAKFIGIALLCISESPGYRPSMETVVQQLG
ncbi:Leucine-rich repeat protein kinase family protein [Rhynchospora pubera]|uniref:Leucine-rich repeat protein kinase family protein n=1 Tax=Rhynchospora pubera TaxID=906938 RepID=A0AAV8E0T4_9POAL|nr:Leucine-rich repeat protein kinase family protein [Rhynchospora pubera]